MRGLRFLFLMNGLASIFFWMLAGSNSDFDRPDDAEVVARRRQEHRHRPRHHDRVQDGFVAIAVDHHDVVRRHHGVPHDLVGGRGAIGHEEQVVGIEDARGIALGSGDGAGMVEQLAEFVHRVAHVGAQHVFAEELVEHAPDGRLQEGHAARVPGTMPGVGTVLRVFHQRAEEGRRQRVHVGLGLADDVARNELRRVLVHVDETVQFAQDVVGDVARGARFAVQVDWNVGILETYLFHKGAQRAQGDFRFLHAAAAEFLVVDGQHERRGPALLLCERGQVTVTGHADDFDAFAFERMRQRAYAVTAGILRAEVLVDDNDGKIKLHK
jgi:hypothetical protein